MCRSYFPIALIKHHDQGNLQKKELGACGFRGWDPTTTMTENMAVSRQAWGWSSSSSWNLHPDPQAWGRDRDRETQTERDTEREQGMMWAFDISKLSTSKAITLNPFPTVPPSGDKVVKHMSQGGPFLFKPARRGKDFTLPWLKFMINWQEKEHTDFIWY